MKRYYILLMVSIFAPAVYSQTYNTNFDAGQNPISESGNWINGKTVGVDWGNVQSKSGLGLGTNLPNQYGDPTAVLTGTWSDAQQAQAVIHVGTPPVGCCTEIELRLRTTIAAHSIKGYEINCSVSGQGYLQVVRWNGPNGNFTYIDQAPIGCKNGDVIKASVTGAANNVQIKVWVNGSIVTFTNHHTTYALDTSGIASGAPGIGFYATSGWDQFGFTSFTASGSGTSTALALSSLRYRANTSYGDSSGNLWAADTAKASGTTKASGCAGSATVNPQSTGTDSGLYKQARYGSTASDEMTETLSGLASGTYALTLYFAEVCGGLTAGRRVFSVQVQGTTVLQNFDIYAAAGGANKAIAKTFTVSVSNGTLRVKFLHGIDNPIFFALKATMK